MNEQDIDARLWNLAKYGLSESEIELIRSWPLEDKTLFFKRAISTITPIVQMMFHSPTLVASVGFEKLKKAGEEIPIGAYSRFRQAVRENNVEIFLMAIKELSKLNDKFKHKFYRNELSISKVFAVAKVPIDQQWELERYINESDEEFEKHVTKFLSVNLEHREIRTLVFEYMEICPEDLNKVLTYLGREP